MKNNTQAFLLLSLIYIFLCLSFHVRVHQARSLDKGFFKPPETEICARPSPPCGASPSSVGNRDRPCKIVPRPPRGYNCSPSKQ